MKGPCRYRLGPFSFSPLRDDAYLLIAFAAAVTADPATEAAAVVSGFAAGSAVVAAIVVAVAVTTAAVVVDSAAAATGVAVADPVAVVAIAVALVADIATADFVVAEAAAVAVVAAFAGHSGIRVQPRWSDCLQTKPVVPDDGSAWPTSPAWWRFDPLVTTQTQPALRQMSQSGYLLQYFQPARTAYLAAQTRSRPTTPHIRQNRPIVSCKSPCQSRR